MKTLLSFALRLLTPAAALALAAAAPAQRGFVQWGRIGSLVFPSDLYGVIDLKVIVQSPILGYGLRRAAAILADGTVRCWGDGDNAPAGLKDVTQVALGSVTAIALRRDGTVVAWGDNTYGQCNVPAGLKDVVQVAVGERGCMALKKDGRIVYWGANTYTYAGGGGGVFGGFGGGGGTWVRTETTVALMPPPGLADVVQIAQSGYNAIALTRSGKVAGWGPMLGGNSVFQPVSYIDFGSAKVIQVAAGPYEMGVLANDGKVWSRQATASTDTFNASPWQQGLANGAGRIAPCKEGVLAALQSGTVFLASTGGSYLTPPAWLDGVVDVSASGYGAFALRAVDVYLPAAKLRAGNRLTGTVTLPVVPAEGGAEVALASSNPLLQVPAAVQLEKGSRTATFPVEASLDIAADGAATVTATYNGVKSTFDVAIAPSIVFSTPSVAAGSTDAISGTLTLDPSPVRRKLTLASDLANAKVPKSLTVEAGQTTVAFPVEHSLVPEARTTTITATVGGQTVGKATLTLVPVRARIEVDATTMTGGTSATGRIVLDKPMTPAYSLKLRSSLKSTLVVPASVAVPAGQTTVTFPISAAKVTKSISVALTVTFAGADRSVTITVVP